MFSDSDKNIILECARKYNVSEVILFGSSIITDEAKDIDIGVKGIKPELFFKFYGELLNRLSKEVNVIDLSKKCLFTDLVIERGIKIYG